MQAITRSILPSAGRFESAIAPDAKPNSTAEPLCFHCGTACSATAITRHEKEFCCHGCLAVFELLTENGLTEFYELGETAGVRIAVPAKAERFRFLDEPAVREKLVDFTDSRITRVTFRLPAIHCIACVWLLENLFRLKDGIGRTRVNFPRKEVAIPFENSKVRLSEVAALLASLGYEPELRYSDLELKPRRRVTERLWLQLGIAGFAFGNTMLLSISSYSGLDTLSRPAFRELFGYLSVMLALPVFFYSASDYWKSAWVSLRQRMLTIDVPIAAGIATLFAQSTFEVVTGRGEGYFDSLAALLFFLLCGKVFQQKTYDRLAFDRDYKSFFPLSVSRKKSVRGSQDTADSEEERVALAQLEVGDHIVIRHGELIPADARLVEGQAVIDYSFVTGEAEPVTKMPGDHLYAGGRQASGMIRVELIKPVSQSYLTSLWNQDAFCKDKVESLDTLINQYSRRFTKIIIGIALGAGVFWAIREPALSLKSFTSVLIVACPCALALAAPFALGTAQRVLARRNVFLKSPGVLEALAKVEAVVFDKTGTLTASNGGTVVFCGVELNESEKRWLDSLTRHSTHPHARRIGEALAEENAPEAVQSFIETSGCGMEGLVAGRVIWMGSEAWLRSRGVVPPRSRGCEDILGLAKSHQAVSPVARTPLVSSSKQIGSAVHVAIDGNYRGCFVLANELRSGMDRLVAELSPNYQLALLSGDNDREAGRFRTVFGGKAQLRFNQSPANKLNFIRSLRDSGQSVMMVGDGLNDAGALKQSDVGVAVVENIGAFSPASDIIMAAGMTPKLHDLLQYAKNAVRVVQASFLISAVYNAVGIAIAARGLLSPVVCAILMPLSSITVVAFACGLTSSLGRKV